MIAEKTYLKPKTIEEAMAFAMEHEEDFRYMAGGTDVIVNKFQGNDEASCLIDITGIDELKTVGAIDESSLHETHFQIGSLVRLDDLKKHEIIAKHFPALLEAAHSVASPILRKTATIGGNILCENRCSFYNQSEWWREAVGYCLKCDGAICIATGSKKNCYSKFVSDTAPVLIAFNAQIEIAYPDAIDSGTVKTHIIPLEDIYTGDGIQSLNLPKNAIIKSVLLPLTPKYQCIFKKLRPREAVDFTSLTTAVSLDENGNIKIVIGGVDPKPIVVKGNINDDKAEPIKKAAQKARTIDNDFYSRTYRKQMISVFLEESFEDLK